MLIKHPFSLPYYLYIINFTKFIQICCNWLQKEFILVDTVLGINHETVTKVEKLNFCACNLLRETQSRSEDFNLIHLFYTEG